MSVVRRALSVSVAILALVLGGCTGRSARTDGPSSIHRFPSDLSDPRLDLAGVYADGWTAPKSSFNLFEPDGPQLLVIRGMIPKIDRSDFKTDLEVRLDDELVTQKSVGLGAFSVEARVPPSPGKHRIGLVFTSVQLLPAGDGRPIGTRLSFAGFEPAPRVPAVGTDIIANGASVRLGSGWHNLEASQKSTFRQADNDAQLLISASQTGTKRVVLVMETESNPDRPVVLSVLDVSGRQVDAAEVRQREAVSLFLPVVAGRDNNFRLHIDVHGESGQRAPVGGPVFRVYRIDTY